MTKYVFVTGGVVSGLGKGITAASLGRLLKAAGLPDRCPKAGPLYQRGSRHHESLSARGSVYVTEDGAETDLDLGHYERFIDEDLNQFSNLTTGKVYWNVLQQGAQRRIFGRDRPGDPPHHQRNQGVYLRGAANRPTRTWSSPKSAAPPATSRASPFWRPSARLPLEVGRENCSVHPCDAGSLHQKLRRAQIQAHPALGQGAASPSASCRTSSSPGATSRWTMSIKQKIALFCNVKPDCVIENLTLACAVSKRR